MLMSGAARYRRHRQGFWRERRVYSLDVGGGGLLGRSPLALTCFLNTGRRGALLSHVFFSRFFSRSLLESAPRRGGPAQLAVQPAAHIAVQPAAQLAVQGSAMRRVGCKKMVQKFINLL